MKIRCAVIAWLLLAALGCSGDRTKKFIPATVVAERAIADALNAWKAGEPVGPVAKTSPLVHMTDTNRKPSQRLNDFKILGEKPAQHGRAFIVELDLENPVEKQKVEYIIVGIDPLWIFRREDYELLMHWDHYMPAGSEPVKKSQTAPKQ